MAFWKTEYAVTVATGAAAVGVKVEEFVENSSIPILGKGANATAPIQVKAANVVLGVVVAAGSFWLNKDGISDFGVGFGGGYALGAVL